jgi:7,8-dihydropterin-6-yl-methyl-4-(beta-D-ribofuranosyl)aminobenzene 5'-phosphate synthase
MLRINSMNPRESLTKITILVDNNAKPGTDLVREHGFSALIARGQERVLFDTGQGPALTRNSVSLGIDLATLDCIVLSHGHYDHTGGLLHVVRLNPGIRVIAHPAVFSAHMALNDDEEMPRNIGSPHSQKTLAHFGAVFDLLTGFREILPRVWFTGEVPRGICPNSDRRLLRALGKALVPDDIIDDASLILDTSFGTVLLLGCAHAGVRNILEHVRKHLGINRIHAVIGGTHLGLSPEAETDAVIQALQSFDVEIIVGCHCTGAGPSAVLASRFADRFCCGFAGMVLEF